MGRKAKESTLEAIKLIGTLRENGSKHTPYSAAKEVGAQVRTVYSYLKHNPASVSNEGISGESQ